MIGQTVSHYRIKQKLGGGGMGVVYLAEDTRLERSVAIKFLPSAYFEDDQAVKRFQREAKAAAALNHPHICTVHDIGEFDGQPYLVMEHLEGENLKHRLANGPLPTAEALKLAVQIADALQTAHSKGIIHRDIKPANIFVTERGDAKVLDFGLAKQIGKRAEGEEDLTTKLTRAGSTLGTLNYMSPEQVKGEVLDPRTDVFSLGVVLYEMLTAVNPFRRDTSGETASYILKEDPPPLSRYTDDVSEALQHILRKMLAKKPERRSQSMHGVCNDLEQLVEDSGRTALAAEPRPRRLIWPASIPVLVLLSLAGYWLIPVDDAGKHQSQGPKGRISIAVLPFDGLSDSPDDEYFSDGITEDITAALTKIGGLKVMGRTSAFRFKGSDKSFREIADELGVVNLLGGSVRRAGGRVRIITELIDGTTGENVWAENYERDLEDIFEVQSGVAEQIASALRVELLPEEVEQIEKHPTKDFEAYNLCLQGRYFRFLGENEQNARRAVELFSQAAEVDPEYAPAYAGLSDSAVFLRWTSIISQGIPVHLKEGLWRFGDPEEAELLEMAQTAAQKALDLDDSLADAHVSMFLLHESRGDPATSIGYLRRAIELNPNLSEAHRLLGLTLLWNWGKYREALSSLREAHQLEPLSRLTLGCLDWALQANGLFEEAMRARRQAQELDPTGLVLPVHTGDLHYALSNWKEAQSWYQKGLADAFQRVDRPSVVASFIMPTLGSIVWLESRLEDARKEAGRLANASPSPSRATFYAGLVARMEGDSQKAIGLFKRAYELSSVPIEMLPHRPFLQGYEYSTWLGLVYWQQGLFTEAEERLNESVSFYRQRLDAGDESPKVRIGLSGVYAIRGEKQEAYRWLERAIEGGFLQYRYLELHPFFTNLHGDARFKQIMAEVETKADRILARVRKMEKEWGWE